MKSDKTFYSGPMQVGKFCSDVSNDVIKDEPMFFNSSVAFAYDNGGPVTRSFIDALPEDFKLGVFDSRVHMLMPGWYPSIPGWHHDDVPRPQDIPVGQHFMTAGQPDYDNPSYSAEHILGLVNAEVAPTEFIHGKCKMKCVPDGELIYRQWHKEIEEMLVHGEVTRQSVNDRTLYYFDCDDFHQGTAAVKNGWRWFGRVSINTDRIKKISNEIRRNAQVYLAFPMEGW